MKAESNIGNVISWAFCLIVLSIGGVNLFWGNDPGLGALIVLLSFVYFPPANNLVRSKTGFFIPVLAKIALAILILWVSLGVGELFDKIDLMIQDL